MGSTPTVDIDRDALTITITARYDHPVERLWTLWADPRRLERWWGPPGFPCAVEQFDFVPGGIVRYAMTGPDGQRYPGWWRVGAIEPPTRLDLVDGFGPEPGAAEPGMPTSTTTVSFTAEPGGGRMTILSRYVDADQLQQMLDLGVEEGFLAALTQVDAFLAEDG